jgi:hypothetical protein
VVIAHYTYLLEITPYPNKIELILSFLNEIGGTPWILERGMQYNESNDMCLQLRNTSQMDHDVE